MSMMLREMRDRLLAGDAEFRRLYEEHSRYETQLEQLSNTPYLSAEDLLLEAKLKKLKLRVKDEIEMRLARQTRTPQTH
jgi:uncharacterized protein YdcH (DUF465 family)